MQEKHQLMKTQGKEENCERSMAKGRKDGNIRTSHLAKRRREEEMGPGHCSDFHYGHKQIQQNIQLLQSSYPRETEPEGEKE